MGDEFDDPCESGAPSPTARSAVFAEEGGPDAAARIAAVYRDAPGQMRVHLLECLLEPVGPLALVSLASGAFSHLLHRLRGHDVPVSAEDAARIAPDHVRELVRYAMQSTPDIVVRLDAVLEARVTARPEATAGFPLAGPGAEAARRGHSLNA